jgi:hypothetical protein
LKGEKHIKERKIRMSMLDMNKIIEDYVFIEPAL